ncbi:MAG: hypothetical protein LUH43_03635 [Clostridia bacterium]|nr:hypothetical protein [Clostridia bacterium]
MKTTNRRIAALILALGTALMFVPSCMDAAEEDKTSGTENAAIEANTTGETSAAEITENDETDDATETAETAETAETTETAEAAETVETAETEITATFTNGVYSGDIAAFELGIAFDDGGDNGVHSSDYSLWSNENTSRYANLSAPETYTVTFDGTEYEGEYLYSYIYGYNTYVSDYYDIDNGKFAVNAQSGEIVYMQRFYDGDDNENACVYTVEQCTEIATSFAEEYIDVDEYEIKIIETSLFTGCYFIKTIDGIESWDQIGVVVSKVVGKVELFMCGMLSSYDASTASTASLTDSVSALTSENATSALETKLDAIYGEYKSYEVQNRILAKLASGDVCLISYVSVEVNEGDEHTVKILLCESSSVTE